MEDKYKRQNKYDAKNTQKFGIKLNSKTDADAISKLRSAGNIQGYIKSLINTDIKLTAFMKALEELDIEGYRLIEAASTDKKRTAVMEKGDSVVSITEENGEVSVAECR